MEVEIIRDLDKFQSLKNDWDYLLDRCSFSTVFQTYEWYNTWLKHFGNNVSLFVLVATDSGVVRAIAPLMIEKWHGFRHLGLIARTTIDYEDFIIEDDCDHIEVLSSFFAAIQQENGWDLFQINKLREDSPTFESLQSVLAAENVEARVLVSDMCPYVPIDQDWDSYWMSLRKSFRKETTRRERMMAQKIGAVHLEDTGTTQENPEELVRTLLRLQLSRRKEVSGSNGVFGDKKRQEFLVDLVGQLSPRGYVHIYMLRIDEAIAALRLTFDFKGKYFQAIPAFDESYAQFAIGRLLNVYVIKEAFSRKVTEVDFLRGAEGYKFDFCPRVRQVYSFSMPRRNLRGHFAHLWLNNIRYKLEQGRYSVSALLHKNLLALARRHPAINRLR